jgi:hypothetical protein
MHLTYEQCPFDLAHVRALYRVLPEVVQDGGWHPIPAGAPFAFYRVHPRGFFQAVYSQEPHRLLDEVLASDPPESEDDASWLLVREDAEDPCYSLASVFTRTFGPARIHDQVNEWLSPFGLRLGPWEDDMRGFADFALLEAGAWADAMRRLKWLEAMTLEVNRAVEEWIAAQWGRIEDVLRASAERNEDPEEVAELPDLGFPQGPKWRSPGTYR